MFYLIPLIRSARTGLSHKRSKFLNQFLNTSKKTNSLINFSAMFIKKLKLIILEIIAIY